MLLVATVTTAAAAGGALYLRAGGESVLHDGLSSAPLSVTGIDVRLSAGPPLLATLEREITAARPPRAYSREVLSLQATLFFSAPQGDVQTRLMWRDGMCSHLQIVGGRCPRGPDEALVSTRTMHGTQLRPGSKVSGSVDGGDALTLRVVGTYALPPADPYWFDGPYFEAHPGNQDGPDTLDTTFVAQAALESPPGFVTAEAQFLLEPERVRLDDEGSLRRDVARFVGRVQANSDQPQAITQVSAVLDRADSDRRDLARSVLLVTLQLVLLAFVVLHLVVADGSEARGGEVALAKLRGFRPGATLVLGLAEPLLLLVLAVPAGLLLADDGVRLLGAAVLAPGTPVAVRAPSLLAAAGALLGGLLAAAAAGRRVLTRPVLEQWRRTGASEPPSRAGQVVEGMLAVGAVVAFVALISHGTLKEGSHSALPLAVPLLLVVVVALAGVRLLPAVCRALVLRTRASSRLGLFIAVRAVARRPAGLRLSALLAVAVGLATFAVNGSLVAAGNRAERAATDVGAHEVMTVRTEGEADLQAVVRAVDPDGRWAMAAEIWLPFGGLRGTLVAVDSRALPHVAHWRGDFAPVPLVRVAAALGAPAPTRLVLYGDAMAVDVSTLTLPTPSHAIAALVTGPRGQVRVALGQLLAGRHRYSGALPACGHGCTLDGLIVPRTEVAVQEVRGTLQLQGVGDRRDGTWRRLPLRLDEPGAWHQQLVSSAATSSVTAEREAVTWTFSVSGGEEPVLLRSALPWPLRVAAEPGVAETPGSPALVNFDTLAVPIGLSTPISVVPGGGSQASLVDLAAARSAVPRFEEFVTQQVWLSADAPRDAVGRLRAAGLQIVDTRTTAARRALLDRSAPALGLLLFAFAAAAAAVLAAGATAVALYLSGRRRSFELAAMLVVGATRRSLLAAAVGEQLLVLGTALVLGVLSGMASSVLVLPAVRELPDAGHPPLRYAPHLGGLTLFLITLTAVVVATAAGAAARLLRRAQPGLLREAAP